MKNMGRDEKVMIVCKGYGKMLLIPKVQILTNTGRSAEVAEYVPASAPGV